ncbi:MAG TPA: pre-mycofactocin synthase MftD [Solirubrobacteraceae bacterium]|nr:pre-mycofactocin synthase MftD [Solirubrobacteraceae bacterium]
MSSHRWFESVAEAERRARRILPRSVFKALIAGSERGLTLHDNLAAFAELGVAPHVAGLAAERSLQTSVMGQALAMPVLISPTGVQAVHPEAEVAVACGAAARGIAMGLSGFATKPVEEVTATGAPTFFQTYWAGSREEILARAQRARAAGAAGLILTLDWSFSHSRDWGSPYIPSAIDWQAVRRLGLDVATHPVWLARYAAAGFLPEMTTPNMVALGAPAPKFFEAYGQWMQTPPPSWEDVTWLRSEWDGPFMLKGITRIDDARRAVQAGVSAISVSNHGGNNLDGTPATIRLVSGIADTVGDQVEVLLDGGVRRGSDVVKALALGARAVMIGRAPLWGLAEGGQAGVENVLDVLRSGIDSALLGLGRAAVGELGRQDVLVPDGFERLLGTGESTAAT